MCTSGVGLFILSANNSVAGMLVNNGFMLCTSAVTCVQRVDYE